MPMPKDQFEGQIIDAWTTYLENLEKSLQMIERDIQEASHVAGVCTNEWCEATEHYIDDISNALFTIHEPRWASPEDTRRLKDLKKRVRELYANYKDVYKSISA